MTRGYRPSEATRRRPSARNKATSTTTTASGLSTARTPSGIRSSKFLTFTRTASTACFRANICWCNKRRTKPLLRSWSRKSPTRAAEATVGPCRASTGSVALQGSLLASLARDESAGAIERPADHGLPVFAQSGYAATVTRVGVEQSDRSPMTMPGRDLLCLSHGYLDGARSQTSFARTPGDARPDWRPCPTALAGSARCRRSICSFR
jgi:hypothetical protein